MLDLAKFGKDYLLNSLFCFFRKSTWKSTLF